LSEEREMKGDDEDVTQSKIFRFNISETNGIRLSWALVIIGIVLIFAVAALALVDYTWPTENLDSAVAGTGTALVFVGMLMLLAQRSIRKNPQYAKEVAISNKDERNILIRNRANARAFEIVFPLTMVVYAVTFVFSDSIQQTLPLSIILCVMAVSSLLLTRKYKKEM